MTKMKSKKMTKSTFAVIIMAIVLVALVAFGGTYAYFNATTTKKEAEFKTGHVYLTTNLNAESNPVTIGGTNVVPGDAVISGAVTVTPDQVGTDVYMAVKFIIQTKLSTADAEWTDADTTTMFNLLGETGVLSDGWTYVEADDVFVYGTGSDALEPVTDLGTDGTATAVNFTDDALEFAAEVTSVEGVDSTGIMDADVRIFIQAASTQIMDDEQMSVAYARLLGLFATPFEVVEG